MAGQAGRLILIIMMMIKGGAGGSTVSVDLLVESAILAPDGVPRRAISLNGGFPGPTIRASRGATRLEVTVTNRLAQEVSTPEGLTIHAHGLHFRGDPWMEGSPHSQCRILPNQSFTYNISLGDQTGTYWYHAHTSMHRSDGAYGALIIEDEHAPFHYDQDRVILLSDWYAAEGMRQQEGVLRSNFTWVGEQRSILVNGRANASCDASNITSCTGLETIWVEPGKTYLLRLIGAQSLNMMDFAIEGHNLTVVEADGHYVSPFEASHMMVNAGERYGVLLKAKELRPGDGQPRDYWVNVQTRYRALGSGFAVLSYRPSGQPLQPATPTAAPAPHPGMWSQDILDLQAKSSELQASGAAESVWLPIKDECYRRMALQGEAWARQLRSDATTRAKYSFQDANRYLATVGTQCRTSEDGQTTFYAPYPDTITVAASHSIGWLRWCTNGRSHPHMAESATPMLYQAWRGEIGDGYKGLVTVLNKGDVVELVLQSGWALNGVSEQHPWHLHGHSFWLLGYGQGPWDPNESWKTLNYVDPPLKDTLTTFPFGWTAIRFVADNPGLQMLHCHIETHTVMGMSLFFLERPDEIPPPSPSMLQCIERQLAGEQSPLSHLRRRLYEQSDSDKARDLMNTLIMPMCMVIAGVVLAMLVVCFLYCRCACHCSCDPHPAQPVPSSSPPAVERPKPPLEDTPSEGNFEMSPLGPQEFKEGDEKLEEEFTVAAAEAK
jgi:L-ascorbate oxidase